MNEPRPTNSQNVTKKRAQTETIESGKHKRARQNDEPLIMETVNDNASRVSKSSVSFITIFST